VETVISCVFFAFESRQTSMARVPYNKLLTNLASSSRTGEYWPSVVFARTSLRSVRAATTSSQYSAVRPSRSVGKRLILTVWQKLHSDNPSTGNDYQLEIIWNNRFIRIAGKPVLYSSWYRNWVFKIYHLLNENRNFCVKI